MSPTTPKNPFRSARLIYRAIEADSDEDKALFLTIQQDPIGYANSNARKGVPQGKADANKYMNHVATETLLGVVICLAPEDTTAQESKENAKPTPIGCIHLDKPSSHMAVHRHTDIGIDILPAYQGKGYGSEAIIWATDYAFRVFGMHRVQLRAFEWNTGAWRLYQRLGFKEEGRWREFLWHEGRFWDDIQFSILESEWREMHKDN